MPGSSKMASFFDPRQKYSHLPSEGDDVSSSDSIELNTTDYEDAPGEKGYAEFHVKTERPRQWSIHPRAARSRVREVALGVALLVIVFLSYMLTARRAWPWEGPSRAATPEKAIIIASFEGQDIDWLDEVPKDWSVQRYLSDVPNPSPPFLGVPRNQGREAMVYLTYIITHYDNLPSHMIFIHGHDHSWHQNVPMQWLIASLDLTALYKEGFINLRCPGVQDCDETQPVGILEALETEKHGELVIGMNRVAVMARAFWRNVFGGSPSSTVDARDVSTYTTSDGETHTWIDKFGMGPPPRSLRAACCAQFAVSREAVLAHPLEFYRSFRAPMLRDLEDDEGWWGLEKGEVDNYSLGVVYEKLWHVVFGQAADLCITGPTCRNTFFREAIECVSYDTPEGLFAVSKNWYTNCTLDLGKVQDATGYPGESGVLSVGGIMEKMGGSSVVKRDAGLHGMAWE